jgi:hypothetical protein
MDLGFPQLGMKKTELLLFKMLCSKILPDNIRLGSPFSKHNHRENNAKEFEKRTLRTL